MNFTYIELATLKYAASKLIECVHQIEAVNITTGGNKFLVPHEYLDSLLDDVDSASKTIMLQLMEIAEMKLNVFQSIAIIISIEFSFVIFIYSAM